MFISGINYKHRSMGSLSVIVGGKGKLTRQQGQFFVIKMAFQFQLYALPAWIVIQIPNAVTETGIYYRSHLILKPPDSIKVDHHL